MTRNRFWQVWIGWTGLALVAGLALPASAEEADPAPVVLKHAVSCPPFKGDPAIATRLSRRNGEGAEIDGGNRLFGSRPAL